MHNSDNISDLVDIAICKHKFCSSLPLSFLSGFSFTDTIDSQDSKVRRDTILIPLYHFQPITDIHTFICNFTCEMTTT